METSKSMIGKVITNPYTQEPFATVLQDLHYGDVVSTLDFSFAKPSHALYIENYAPSWFYDAVEYLIWERDNA